LEEEGKVLSGKTAQTITERTIHRVEGSGGRLLPDLGKGLADSGLNSQKIARFCQRRTVEVRPIQQIQASTEEF